MFAKRPLGTHDVWVRMTAKVNPKEFITQMTKVVPVVPYPFTVLARPTLLPATKFEL